jgi:cell division protease FtsH
MPKAALLVGPPGTGKTLLARATAGEAGVPFFSIDSAELVEWFGEAGSSSVRGVFEQARRYAPAILFLDDINKLGTAADSNSAGDLVTRGGQVLDHFLIELDSLDSGARVAVLAAANNPGILDPALLRSGRFEPVPVPRPDEAARAQILRLHAREVRISTAVDLAGVAASTAGFTGADLARLVNKAALLATRRGADAVGPGDFAAAVERILAGLATNGSLRNAHEREVLAYHEVGHALLALSLPGPGPVRELSTAPRDVGAAGCSFRLADENRILWAHQELDNQMVLLLAGRAAEDLVFGEFSTLGAIDLQQATMIAHGIAARYGMTAELGQVYYGEPRERSEETARKIDGVVKSLIDGAFRRAGELLRAQRGALERGAQLLVRDGTLDPAMLAELRQRHWSKGKETDDRE